MCGIPIDVERELSIVLKTDRPDPFIEGDDHHALIAQLTELGVRHGGVLLVHTSYRAVRPVSGGPSGLISALRAALGDEGTLVMPAWGDDDDAPFDAATTPVSDSLGITAQVFAQMPGVRRCEHPFAFVAAGPHSMEIVGDVLPTPPHRLESPVGRVYELDGQVLLLGVGHSENTTVHLAEVLANVPYGVQKHCTISAEGRPTRVDYVETDHCCAGFAKMDSWLRAQGLQREGMVGRALARLLQSRDVVRVAREHLAADPLEFLCASSMRCAECDAARASVR